MGADDHPVFILNGALSEELAAGLLALLLKRISYSHSLLIIKNATRIFCHSSTLQRLKERGLEVQVADPINILALTINPYTPEYPCIPQRLVEALLEQLPAEHPPIIDVVSGLYTNQVL